MDRADTGHALDVITIGRSSVDLYGQQIGSRLEDITSFAKSVGGCPANIAIGTARLGLRSALLSRVGDEQIGRYIREQMVREGVATDGIITDAERLSALVILSVENDKSFPLIFYRENCADMALDEGDVDPEFIRSARAVVVTGTHFSKPKPDAAQRKAIRLMKEAGGKVVFDIDYRPNLWGLAGHGEGDSRYIASDAVSSHLKTVLADCDLIVGTEEEVLIASGEEDLLSALKTIRALSSGTIVLKRGPMGCIVYEGAISDDLEDGIVGKGFPIEVFNVLGAGDAFMSGFLRGWLGGESLATAATWANACGAFAVSRLLCAPEDSDLRGTAIFPQAWQQISRPAQGRGNQPCALGNDAEARDTLDDDVRHRSSCAAGGPCAEGRCRRRQNPCIQGAGGEGSGKGCGWSWWLRHAA